MEIEIIDRLQTRRFYDGFAIMMVEAIEDEEAPRSKAGEIFRILKADILSGRLRPGERLGFSKLRTQYPFGLAPIREALVRLAADGLAQGEEQRGFHVPPISRKDLLDITCVSIQLETEAITGAIKKASAGTDIALVTAFHKLDETSPTSPLNSEVLNDAWSERHTDFHESLVVACGSPWLLKLRRTLFDQAERYRRISFSFSAESRDLAHEHRALMSAVLDRDVERAHRLIKIHWQTTADIIIRDLEPELWSADD